MDEVLGLRILCALSVLARSRQPCRHHTLKRTCSSLSSSQGYLTAFGVLYASRTLVPHGIPVVPTTATRGAEDSSCEMCKVSPRVPALLVLIDVRGMLRLPFRVRPACDPRCFGLMGGMKATSRRTSAVLTSQRIAVKLAIQLSQLHQAEHSPSVYDHDWS